MFPKKFCSSSVLSYSFHNNISSLCTGVISQDIIYDLKNSLIIHLLKEKQKKLQLFLISISDIKTQLNFTSNFLDQNNPKSKYWCKNELIYMGDFEAIQKTPVMYYQV